MVRVYESKIPGILNGHCGDKTVMLSISSTLSLFHGISMLSHFLFCLGELGSKCSVEHGRVGPDVRVCIPA